MGPVSFALFSFLGETACRTPDIHRMPQDCLSEAGFRVETRGRARYLAQCRGGIADRARTGDDGWIRSDGGQNDRSGDSRRHGGDASGGRRA